MFRKFGMVLVASTSIAMASEGGGGSMENTPAVPKPGETSGPTPVPAIKVPARPEKPAPSIKWRPRVACPPQDTKKDEKSEKSEEPSDLMKGCQAECAKGANSIYTTKNILELGKGKEMKLQEDLFLQRGECARLLSLKAPFRWGEGEAVFSDDYSEKKKERADDIAAIISTYRKNKGTLNDPKALKKISEETKDSPVKTDYKTALKKINEKNEQIIFNFFINHYAEYGITIKDVQKLTPIKPVKRKSE